MLTLQEVSKTYPVGKDRSVEAVRGVSLGVQRAEFLVITGRSGSGKTTLLNLAAGLTRPSSGRVEFDGVDLWQLPDRERSRWRGQTIGFVFQFPSLLPSLTVMENVALPATFAIPNGKANGGNQRAAELLEMVGLTDKIDMYPRQLSAGQQQRVVIARSLLNQPQLLLADEPTSDLDEQTELEIMDLFQSVHRSTGVTIMLVTHTSQLVRYGTRSIQMAAGTFQRC